MPPQSSIHLIPDTWNSGEVEINVSGLHSLYQIRGHFDRLD